MGFLKISYLVTFLVERFLLIYLLLARFGDQMRLSLYGSLTFTFVSRGVYCGWGLKKGLETKIRCMLSIRGTVRNMEVEKSTVTLASLHFGYAFGFPKTLKRNGKGMLITTGVPGNRAIKKGKERFTKAFGKPWFKHRGTTI